MSDTLTLELGASIPEADIGAGLNGADKYVNGTRNWTFDLARAALRHIHPNCDFPEAAFKGRPALRPYELWRNIGSALIGQFGKDAPETFALFEEWSSGRLAGVTPKLYKPEKIREQFGGLDTSNASMGTVEWWATEGGWKPEAELLARLEKLPADPSLADQLTAEIATARLSPIDFENAIRQVQRITGLGKGVLKDAVKEQQKAARQNGGGGSGRVSPASVLVKLGLECDLWQSTDPKPELFATVDRLSKLEHLRIGSSYFKQYLVHRYYESTGETASSEAVSQALGVLKGYAQEKGKKYDAWLRIAKDGDALYLDLGDEDGNVIEITAGGWKPVKRPPVRLVRGMGKALPMPVRGGDIDDLCALLGGEALPLPDKMKVAAWCVAAFRPGFPYTILILLGEQGSGKSTKLKMLKALIDPSKAPGRGLPKTEDHLVISASNNHVITADNLSSMSEEIANAICRLSTGGGNAKRKLYDDGDEFVMEAMRPIIINGINIPSERQDLLDRALIVDLPSISSEERRTEKELWEWFEAKRPVLLGVLLDGVVAGLRGEAALRKRLKVLPRMADFACFAAAAMEAWGWDAKTFLKGYEEAREQAAAEAAKTDVVLVTVRDWIQRYAVKSFEGNAEDLLTFLGELRRRDLDQKGWKQEHRWPASANHLSRRLKAGAVGLRALGVGYEKAGSTKEKLVRLWCGNTKPAFTGKGIDQKRKDALLQDAISGANGAPM